MRAAYGKAGIQPGAFDRYQGLIPQQTGNELAYASQTGAGVPPARNPDLDVEVSSEKEIGTDLTVNIFKGSWLKSVNVPATYWERQTDNAIFPINVAPSIGIITLLTNSIALSSHGWQVAVNIPVFSSKDLTWDVTANFGHQTSIIDAVQGGDIPLTSAAGSEFST